MPTIHPAPEPVSPEPIALATRSSRGVARSPEPTFVSIPAVSVAALPAMVPMPTMVPAPVPAPSTMSNDSISLPPSEPATAVPDKPKTGFAGILKPGLLCYSSYYWTAYTQCRRARLVTVAGVCCRRCLSSVTCICNVTHQGTAHGGPVVLCPVIFVKLQPSVEGCGKCCNFRQPGSAFMSRYWTCYRISWMLFWSTCTYSWASEENPFMSPEKKLYFYSHCDVHCVWLMCCLVLLF